MENAAVARELNAEIAQAEWRLAELDRLRRDAAARLDELHRLRATPDARPIHGDELSAASKVSLFRDLFRGREDVFAARWENQARGRSGYAPRCTNEWRHGICGKPKVRCGACQNQAFIELGDQELLAHLQGHQIVGIYPLLTNDTCRLLAIDLDGRSWQADARAIRETCKSLDLEPAIERSRSGNGAHPWFFFAEPVRAADARRLGLAILTRTMASGAPLGVDSYDRLFPSQDVVPAGGFGNLIALPLQLAARKVGNTEFLTEELEPHPDQWSFLASVPRITADQLGEVIHKAAANDGTLAVRSADEDRHVPWRPSPTIRDRLDKEAMPRSLAATLADRLYIDRSAAPPVLAHALRRVATFSNPMFLERQRMRMSVARTPRVIGCFEDLERHIALPRGCLADAEPLPASLT